MTLAGFTAAPNNEQANYLFWDVVACIQGKSLTLEVKYDKLQAKTGNVAVEFYNTRKNAPSGIEATKSDLWVFVLDNPTTVWIAKTCVLKHYFHSNYGRVIRSGGDNNSNMKLFRSEKILKEIFVRIDNMNPEKIKRTVLSMVHNDDSN